MTNNNAPIGVIIFGVGVIIFGVATVIFAAGMGIGSAISETGNITGGRNQGIVFCTEKPKECAVEYSYIKLKEAQK